MTKRKTRMAVQGHPGNMQKGVHYDKTFSATPQEASSRLLCALVVYFSLFRAAFDITKAFCWAEVPDGDQIALEYPEGYKRYTADGEPMYMILRKNLYGHPAAGRQYGKQRDQTLLQRFNQDGWTCERARMDPCMFKISRNYQGAEQWLLLLVHVDDCDIAGTTQKIIDDAMVICADIWELTTVDPEFMLGVRRRLTRDQDTNEVQSVELDMVAFVEGMHTAFQDRMPGRRKTLPITDSFTCSVSDEVPTAESQAVLAAGYQCAMGMLLWASRRVYTGCRVGGSLLCRVMSRPSWKAFYEAMGMIQWMYEHRTTGIRFTRGVNLVPMGMVDASNKPDPKDGKCQFGYVFMFMGGPIMDLSKKLRHIGLSSEHNEYMALAFAHQGLVWLRQLLTELGFAQLVEKPTIMWEDNKPAITLSQEDIVTQGNQYMYLPYHFNKEVQEEGLSDVRYVASGNNLADLLTKCVGVKEFQALHAGLTGYDNTLIQELDQQAYEQ